MSRMYAAGANIAAALAQNGAQRQKQSDASSSHIGPDQAQTNECLGEQRQIMY